MIRFARLSLIVAALTAAAAIGVSDLGAAKKEKPVVRDYSLVRAAPAPRTQEWDDAETKSAGCTSCHTASDAHTMHRSPAVVLGCTDCHGGNPRITRPENAQQGGSAYVIAQNQAHVLPRYPGAWHFPSSANPARTYTLLNIEAPEFVRFVNPSDYRAVRDSCGACHIEVIEAAERSLMATGAMLWGGAAYNNGILPFKNYLTGEAYTQSGESALIRSPLPPGGMTEEQRARGVLAELYPLPTWHVIPPADVFRVFERGGRNIGTQFPEIGLPNIGGIIQRLEEPGRPDLRQSNRGPGTGIRVAIPVLNIHKTRLNDPYMWFMGTNDQPGDYRHSGCAGCHVVYANDREPRHSMTYAGYGRDGQTVTADPTIASLQQGRESHGGGGEEHGAEAAGHEAPADANHASVGERGHPLRHVFTRAIPTSQCMTCHMHQPNIFLNSYLGYTMWDYESDADLLWPGPENRLPARNPGEEARFRTQAYPTAEEAFKVLDRNPEAAATRGLWADPEFLREVYDRVNPHARQTQFADYHGHGWNFRGIFRRDREGNLLDGNGQIVPADDPDTFRRANEGLFVPAGVNPGRSVHMMDIHAERGLQCADCHFAQDAHGNGFIYGEVANAVEIGCRDCHGTARDYANLRTSGPAAPPRGRNLETIRNEDGRRRFEWVTCERARLEVPAIECAGEQRILLQRSIVDPNLSWPVSQVRDSADRDLPLCHEQGDRPTDGPCFNLRSARSKLVARSGAETGRYLFGAGVPDSELAHPDSEMACFTCHLSWTTSCGGCHLPIEANWRTTTHHFEAEETRNFATYNPQVARDEIFQLGRHQTSKGNIIAPIRSTSALILSSTNINRERIYVQQPPISSAGYSSQAFAPHFPHTVRRTETKQCTDCHLSAANDNNAIMAQLMLHGTNFINFVGMHAWSGLENGFQATRVTEWDEPQAVIGSYLHRYAYPDYFRMHVDRNSRELRNWVRGRTFDRNASGETQALEEFANVVQGTSGAVRCLQNRGEYMFVAEGRGGFRVYDIASIGNKGFSERIVSAPVSPLGQDTRVSSRNATCMALPTNQPIAPERNRAMAETRRPGPNGTTVSLLEENQEQPFHPIYDYAVVTDAEEGLFLVDVDTLADGNALNNNLRRATLAGGGDAWNENGMLTGARHITLAGHYAYITATAGLVVIDLDNPLAPRHLATLPLTDARASALQFRYLWVTDAEGLKLFNVTDLGNPVPVPEATVPMENAQRIYLARTYAYVAAKQQGLAIVNITNPERPRPPVFLTFDGRMNDVEDVVVASTNAALYAYVADGRNGLKVLQLTSFGNSNTVYGFSPRPQPELIAWARTPSPALSVAKGLDRDRGVDETGGQIAVFGRLGSRPFNRGEQQMLYLNSRCFPYMVSDSGDLADWVPLGAVVPNTPERAAGAICGRPGQPPATRQAP
jgi:LVIVD repeat